MQKRIRVTIGLGVVILLLISACMYQLREGSVAVITRLGRPHRTELNAGLHLRYPWPIENVYRFDNRKRVLETSFTETLTRERKNVILLNYAVWDINDPLKFLQALHGAADLQIAEMLLDGIITDAKNAVMGNYDLSALVSTNEEDLNLAAIEQDIHTLVAQAAEEQLGVNVYEVAILRLALPQDNIARVFEQMRSERGQYAQRFRSEGERIASDIRSATDLEAEEILAEAEETAAGIRSQADAQAASVYAAAHSQDPQFYRFLRSLEALEAILGENATLVLDTESAPFDLLEEE